MSVDNENREETPKKKKRFRPLRIFAKIMLGILLFLLLLVLFIRSEWGQGIIVNKAVKYISDKTQTKVVIDKLYITFDGDILLKGLYLDDKKGDTLVYAKSLEADIPLFPIIRGNGIGLESLDLNGLRANVTRKDSISGYNFQFLIDAFAITDTVQKTSKENTKPLELILGELNLKTINVVFNDAVLGIDSYFVFDELLLDMGETNLESMTFKANEIALKNAKIKYHQSPVVEVPNTEPTTMPILALDKFTLENTYVDYQSFGDGMSASLDIADLELRMPLANLVDSDINISLFSLQDSKILFRTKAVNAVSTSNAEEIVKETKPFEWPNITFNIDALNIERNKIQYFVGDAQAEKGVFNPNAIVLESFTLKGNNIFIKDKEASATITETNFNEFSGFNLKNIGVAVKITDTELLVKDLILDTYNSSVNGNASLSYPSVSQLIAAPDTSKIDINISTFQFDVNEVFTFQPQLKENEYLKKLSKKVLIGNLNASGYLSNISIPSANVTWGKGTAISAKGTIKNATDLAEMEFNFPKLFAKTSKADILQFVNEKELGISLPKNVELLAEVKGSPSNMFANAKLKTTHGVATVKGTFKNNERIAFNAVLGIDNYAMGQLLQNEQLGNLSLSINAKGAGRSTNELDAVVDATISSFAFNNYEIKDLKLNGILSNGNGTITSNYKDENINGSIEASVVLDSIATEANVKLNLIGADLQALGLMQRDVRTALILTANFKKNRDGYNASALLENGRVVYDNKTYLVGDLNAKARVRKDSTAFSVKNRIVDFELESNTDPETFSTALQNHVSSYFYRDTIIKDTVKNAVKLKIRGAISEAPLLKEVFLVNIEELDTVNIAVDFDENLRKLQANITAPLINYSGNKIDSLSFSMDTDKDKFIFNFGFKNIKAGPVDIQRTLITGNQVNNELDLGFEAFQNDSTLIQIKSQITGNRERLRFHIIPEDLVIQKKQWNTPETNEIIFNKLNDDYSLDFNDFNFSRNTQSVSFKDDIASISKEHIAVNFQDFKLSEFLNYLNPEEKFAKGKLSGNFIVEDPFGATGIIADLTIKQLNLLDVEMGTLTLDAKSLGGSAYNFNAAIKGAEVDLDLIGDYKASKEDAELNLDLALNRINMKALEGFSLGELTKTSGTLRGNFNVEGTLAAPKYDGEITFDNAALTVKKLNAPFKLINESIVINNEGLRMDTFTVRDAKNNTFMVNGEVGTERFLNPTFNLEVKADNFQMLNASKKDNELVYGQATINADITIKGDLQIPKVNVTASIDENTDITYVLPSTAVNLESREGVVIFVNRKNPDAILTRTQEETATVSGFDIAAKIKVGKNAKVNIIIDENTGDNFQVYGDGDFDFRINPNGNMTLSGIYTAAGGHYEMNLYNLVNRKFELVSGSKITWSGDPFDADLDVKALYNVDASASSLMASVTSGSDPSVSQRFKQVLPFEVYLNIDGELTAPVINFNLDMPEDEQGAISGLVYGKVQELNSDEAELNKQIFSLLVLNRFYPEAGSDGSNGGVASIARDNINDALADQLNVFSDKLLGDTGLELDFGLDSYTDYQGDSPEERTQLDIAAQKKLFDDRLIVRVGSAVDLEGSSSSTETTPLVGNVSLEYLLTENGRYRLKGFRRNEYENVIDGQTIVSGIALIFTQEFNQFKDLWDDMLRSKSKKEEAKKLKEKEAEEKLNNALGDTIKETPTPENNKTIKE
ncbi:translocation/assembly module TamB [Algibacter sp. L1A34]|uniref:translocation/assembly module TamB domain-containing protein n=1 Tax=Algibacter sp. L1A34 TaxID=2686365 RepID=UPI001E4BE6B1|nr:translocation/assembly module TamB domain-containing protein [Algibacter sp. L1A34]